MLTAYIIVTLILWIASIAVNILTISISKEKNASATIGLIINLSMAIWAASLIISGT